MIRVGIVGLGKMGLSHYSLINAHPDVEVVAVCDASTYLLAVVTRYNGVHTYSDMEKMLNVEPLDAVVISTPSSLHIHGENRDHCGRCDILRETLWAGP